MQSHAPDPGKLVERIGQLREPPIAQAQRIAPAQNQLADAGVGAQPGKRGRPPRMQRGLFGVRKVTAEAVATMHRARARRDDERATVILLQQALLGAAREVADGVGGVAGARDQLRGLRQHLQQQRIARIAATHARDEPARRAQGEALRRLDGGQDQGAIEAEDLAQLGGVRHCVGKEPPPVCGRLVALARKGGCGYHLRPLPPRGTLSGAGFTFSTYILTEPTQAPHGQFLDK